MQEADSSRVIRLDRAIRCCQSNVDRVASTLYRVAQHLLSGPRDGSLALLPIPALAGGVGAEITGSLLPEVVTIPTTAVAPVGAVIILGYATLWELDKTVGRQYLAEMVSNLADGVSIVNRTKTDTKTNPCRECMLRNALPQYPQARKELKTTKGQTISVRV